MTRIAFLSLTCFVFAPFVEGALLRGPYLQMANPEAITMRWRADNVGVGTVRYGTTEGALTQSVAETAARTEHEVRLTGLTAATTYYYAVEVDNAPLAGGADYHFTTPPVVGSTGPFRFWALGDAGTSGGQVAQNPNQLAVRDSFAALHAVKPADFLMMLGDNAYFSGFDIEYQRGFFDIYPTYLMQIPVWSCLGNHETYSNAGAPPYFDMFTFPTGGECGGLASGTEHFFSFNYANVHFISLDFMQSSRLATGAQAVWLKSDLENVTLPWTVVFFHHPPYTRGSHNSDFEGDLVELREQMMPILENAGVDLVLSGHSHAYERSWFMRDHFGYSTSFNAASHVVQPGNGQEDGDGIYQKYVSGPEAGKGTVYVVAGSSGQATGGLLNHPAMYKSLNRLGSVVVDVSNNRLDLKFLTTTGNFDDHFSMEKANGGPIVLPGEPVNVALLATGGPEALLRWDDVAAETHFDVEQSGDGAAFTVIGTVGANQTSHNIAGLVPGQQYWFRVRARNFNGSTPSTSLTATHTPPVTPVASLTKWRFSHFGVEADTGQAASLADPDGDGNNNLMEYAMATDPRKGNPPQSLTAAFDEEDGVYVISFPRYARPDISYTVQVSPDLSPGSWTNLYSSSGAANVLGQVYVPDYNAEDASKRFARLMITNP